MMRCAVIVRKLINTNANVVCININQYMYNVVRNSIISVLDFAYLHNIHQLVIIIEMIKCLQFVFQQAVLDIRVSAVKYMITTLN